jgi:hypothetical protein
MERAASELSAESKQWGIFSGIAAVKHDVGTKTHQARLKFSGVPA